VKAWLERLVPPGPPIQLPDRSGVFVFGRSPRATLVFDDEGVAARHCELRFDDGFWRLRDLGAPGGTWLNEHPVAAARALFQGDELRFGGVRLRFQTDLPIDDPGLLAAIARDPDAPEPWLVYADQLEERGDPLGLRISRARAGARLDHQPWLGPLWEALVSGELEIDWHLGFVRSATLRTVAGRLPLDWRSSTAALFGSRVGRFVRRLAIDVPRLEERALAAEPEALAAAQRWLAAQPTLPRTLTELDLGYRLGAGPPSGLEVLPELLARAPGLAGARVYRLAPAAGLRLLSVSEGVRVSGLVDGRRPLSGVVRLRRGSRTQLHLEIPPGLHSFVESPCYFTGNEGRVRLFTGRMRGEVRVNARHDAVHALLPGDLIEVLAGARFRFELN
jgi:uncharacterized protein (TIGR02996 family)